MVYLIFQNHCQQRFEYSTHGKRKNGEKVLFVLLSSHRDLLQVICDFAIHTTNPAVLEPWKKRNWLLYRCSVACCSEEHLSLHRDSVKCFPYRSLPRLVWCGVGCISQKSYSSLNWQFWVFLCKKRKKGTTGMSIQVVPGRRGRKLPGGFTWYQSRRGGLFALLLCRKYWNIQNMELDKRIMA